MPFVSVKTCSSYSSMQYTIQYRFTRLYPFSCWQTLLIIIWWAPIFGTILLSFEYGLHTEISHPPWIQLYVRASNGSHAAHRMVYSFPPQVFVTWKFSSILPHCLVFPLKKQRSLGLAGVAQWIESGLVNQTVAGLTPSRGHMPGLQVRSPVGGAREATTLWCFLLSFSFS